MVRVSSSMLVMPYWAKLLISDTFGETEQILFINLDVEVRSYLATDKFPFD